jgi:hypothetical protein
VNGITNHIKEFGHNFRSSELENITALICQNPEATEFPYKKREFIFPELTESLNEQQSQT